jgi:hypothetical protein
MAKRHGMREQKKLAAKKAKQNLRRRPVALRQSADLTVRLKAADRWPIVTALVPENLWSSGIGNLLIARRMSDERLAIAAFLVDVFCLGVKNAFWKIVTPREFDSLRHDIERMGKLRSVAPDYFAKLVYQVVDYAQSLGFRPHRDFQEAQLLLAGMDPSQCGEEFQFGQNGQPLYIRGPSESPERARLIANRVDDLGGKYVVRIDPAELPIGLEALDDAFDRGEVDGGRDPMGGDIIDVRDF